jgi:proline iminopeptidase
MVATTSADAGALVPAERRIETSDGTTLYLKIAGRGPVCMFVHGGPGQGTLSFEKMGGDSLESFSTIVYLDQRGSGRSSNAKNYHLDRVVQDFEEVRQALGVDKLCLIAHSFGGILAVEYAKRYPDHVSGLVMANAATYFHSPQNTRMRIDVANRILGRDAAKLPDNASKEQLDAAQEETIAALGERGLLYRFLSEKLSTVEQMSKIDRSYPRTIDFGMAVVKKPDELPEYYVDHSSITASITVPVLVISGTKDYAVGPEQYKTFRFPHQSVVQLDSGHLPYYENTAEFAATIRRFVVSLRPAP